MNDMLTDEEWCIFFILIAKLGGREGTGWREYAAAVERAASAANCEKELWEFLSWFADEFQ